MKVLGLNCGYNGSVSVVVDGQVKSFVKTGDNFDRGVTKIAIKEALDSAGLKLRNIDVASVVNWFSDRYPDGQECWDKNEEGFSLTKENGIEFSLQDYIEFYQNPSQVALGTYNLNIGDQVVPCMVVDHIFTHSAYAYLTSPFDNCMSICVDTHDGFGATNAIYWIQDSDKSFRPWRRDQQFSPINTYTSFTDYIGNYPAIENLTAIQELAGDKRNDDPKLNTWAWPNNIQMGNLFHGDQWAGLMSYEQVTTVPDKIGYFPSLTNEGTVDDNWLDAKDTGLTDRRTSIAIDVLTIVESSIRSYVNTAKDFGNNVAIGGKVTMFDSLVKELSDDKTFFTQPHNDEELSAGSALFISDQLMKNKKGEIITNTKSKITAKEVIR